MLKLLFYIACTFLFFIAGAVSLYFNAPTSSPIHDAIKAGEALYEQFHTVKGSRKHGETTKSNTYQAYWNKDKAFNGYTLVSESGSNIIKLVDMKNKVAHRWDTNFIRIWPEPAHTNYTADMTVHTTSAHVYPNGDLLLQFSGLGDTPYGYGLARLDKNGDVIWKYDGHAHHHFYIDKMNGNIFVLTQEMIMDRPSGIDTLEFPMLVDYITELTPEGKEVQNISLLDAYMNSDFSHMIQYKLHDRAWDHFHMNSVMKLEADMAKKFPMFAPGQLLVSIRNPNILAVIDMAKKKVVWSVKGTWKQQHDAQFIDDGSILLFDNIGASNSKKKASRALAINPNNLHINWQYPAKNKGKKFYSVIRGNVQLLDNGNLLINSSEQNRIFEVTKSGELVWQYKNQVAAKTLIAKRYSKQQLPFLLKD